MTRKKRPHNKKTKRQLSIYATVVLLFVAFIFFFTAGIKQVRQIYYGNQARSAFNEQADILASPLKALGLNVTNSTSSECTESEHFGYSEKQIECRAIQDNFVVIDKNNKQDVLSGSKQLDKLIKDQGGAIISNAAPTFEKWFTDIAEGRDYYPDLNGEVSTANNKTCAVRVNVAYSNPKPPAYRIALECSSPILKSDSGI